MTDAPDGTQLATYRWSLPAAPETEPRGVYLLHGLGEYAGRYEHVAAWLNARGWDVGAHDHRGHGRSGGNRGTLRHEDDLVIDAEQQIVAYTTEIGKPPVLLGHEIGGLVAIRVALRGKVELAGLVLSSPAFRLRLRPGLRLKLRLLKKLAPNLRVAYGERLPKLSHDRAVIDTYLADPMITRVITARLAGFLAAGGAVSIAEAATLPWRTLMLVAGDDHIVDGEDSRKFAHAAAPGKLALRWYDQAWHEVLNEAPEIANSVYADLDAWLTQIQ